MADQTSPSAGPAGWFQQASAILGALLEAAPVAVIAWDADAHVRFWSRGAESLLGWQADEVLGRADPIGPEDAAGEHAGLLQQVLGGGRCAGLPLRARRKDGNLVDVALWGGPVRDQSGAVVGWLGILIDQTRIIRAEARQRASVLELEQAFERVPVALYRSTLDGRLLAVNSALVELLRYPDAPALLAKNARDLYADPDDRARWLQALDEQGVVRGFRTRLRRDDGTTVWVEDTAQIVRRESGGAFCEGCLIDVSARVEIEALQQRLVASMDTLGEGVAIVDADGRFVYVNPALAQMYGFRSSEEMLGRSRRELYSDAELERFDCEILPQFAATGTWSGSAVGRRRDGSTFPQEVSMAALPDGGLVCIDRDITEHVHMEEQLRQAQKLEAIGLLTSGIAHDFNNLLNVIRVNAELLAGFLLQAPEPQAALDDLQRAAEQATRVVQKLLAFSRKEATAARPVDLGAALRDLMSTLQRLLPETITTELLVPEAAPWAVVDPAAIEQIVMNLVTNARDAMPRGGHLTVRLASTVLERSDTVARTCDLAPGAYACIAVSDTGTGIPRELLARVFDPFFTTKPPGHGTGLGLSVVYGLAQRYRGGVTIYSEPGHGTVVKVYLPATGPVESAERPEARPLPRGAGELLLLVEDEASLRRTAQRTPERFGYRVLAAENGERALELLEREQDRIAAVITDVVMPRMSGIELYRRLSTAGRQVPFIFTSGYAAEHLHEAPPAGSTVAYLEKPWSVSDLAGTVQRILDAAQAGITDHPSPITRKKRDA